MIRPEDWDLSLEQEKNETFAFTPSYEPTPYMARVPISAPVWMWLAYGFLLLLLGIGGTIAKMYPLYPVLFTAAFSFQFWTYAVWRGYCIDYAKFKEEHSG